MIVGNRKRNPFRLPFALPRHCFLGCILLFLVFNIVVLWKWQYDADIEGQMNHHTEDEAKEITRKHLRVGTFNMWNFERDWKKRFDIIATSVRSDLSTSLRDYRMKTTEHRTDSTL